MIISLIKRTAGIYFPFYSLSLPPLLSLFIHCVSVQTYLSHSSSCAPAPYDKETVGHTCYIGDGKCEYKQTLNYSAALSKMLPVKVDFFNLHPNFWISKTLLILWRLTYSEGPSLYPDVFFSFTASLTFRACPESGSAGAIVIVGTQDMMHKHAYNHRGWCLACRSNPDKVILGRHKVYL